MNHCKNCGQDFEGNFCPKCGTAANDQKRCPNCGEEINGNFCANCGYSVNGKQADKQPVSAKLNGAAVLAFLKKYWVWLLVGVLALIAFLTLMITLVGLRGIYVNVNDPDDYYDFDATSYRASVDTMFGGEELEEGTWKLSGNTLTLTINDEDFGKMSDDFDFQKLDGFKRIKIDDKEYKRVSFVGLKTTKQKLKINFDVQGAYDGGATKKLPIGTRLPSLEEWGIGEPYNGSYGFLGWYSKPNGEGSRYYEGERMWENRTYYAYWCTEHVSSAYGSDANEHWQFCDRCGKEFNHRSHYIDWITTKQPTCTEEGTEAYQCKCGYKDDTYETRSVEATGHDYGEWVIDTEDYACLDAVTAHRECSVCTYREIKEDYIAPHVYGEWIEDSAPTCSQYGKHHRLCEKCGSRADGTYGALLPHVLDDWVIDNSSYTCGDTVTRHRDCVNCEYVLTEENYIIPHDFDLATKRCRICNRNDFATGDTMSFGEYPQTRETDNGIVATLSQMSGDRPVYGNAGKWTDYGYYDGYYNDEVDEYMWYIDLEYSGAKYRGVYFTSYRPLYTRGTSSSNQSANGYYINTLYWFKWEPIEWRVLETADGEIFLMSNVILDSQQYYHEAYGSTRTINGKTVYENNYKESDIRTWLNGTFYEQAFDSAEQNVIKTTLVDNSAATTGYNPNEYACENTNDKVFLLSYKDVTNAEYGFSSDSYDSNLRQLKLTDYARSQGACTYIFDYNYNNGLGVWWLRSPDYSGSSLAFCVYYDGYAVYDDADCYNFVYSTECGVVPAIKIQL